MALLNTGCSISVVQADITGITTGYAAECFAVLAAAVDSATQDRCVTVPTSGSLPSLYPTQTIPQGQVVFVEDVGVPVVAASGKWIGFDQRIFRRDFTAPVLYSWGYNGFGQLGDGTATSRLSPVTTVGDTLNWRAVGAGLRHGTAIKTDNTLWTWGSNGYGRLGDGTTTTRSSPGTTAGGGANWCLVSAGRDHTAAIKTDGTLWTWGYNSKGQLGDGTVTSRRSPGTTAGGGSTWCAVSAGWLMTAAIKTDGTLWTWGNNANGQLGDGTTTSRSVPGTPAGGGTNWRSVSLGVFHSSAIKSDGTLWTWGYNGFGRLGDGTTTQRQSPGTTAGGGTNWCAVSISNVHSTAIKTDGRLWTWGYNGFGRLGDGTTTQRESPVTTAGGGTNWCAVSAGDLHTAALKTDGTLWIWGRNDNGQLGDGTLTDRCSPITTAGGGTTWCTISTGCRYTLGIRIV